MACGCEETCRTGERSPYNETNSPKNRGISWAVYRCDACWKLEHIATWCPNTEEPMQWSLGDRSSLCGLTDLVGVTMTPHRYTQNIGLNGIETIALVDSGRAVMLVSGWNQLFQAKCTGITHLQGAINYYQAIPK